MKPALVLLALTACAEADSPQALATYRVDASAGQATAWVVDDGLLITAGHVCSRSIGPLRITSLDGNSISATSVWWADDPPLRDICLLRSEGQLEVPIELSVEMPNVGDRVTFYGYLDGKFTMSVGGYVGDADGIQRWDDYFATTPCGKGVSGSAMLVDGRAYGVLVRQYYDGEGLKPGEMGCAASPLDQILEALGHR